MVVSRRGLLRIMLAATLFAAACAAPAAPTGTTQPPAGATPAPTAAGKAPAKEDVTASWKAPAGKTIKVAYPGHVEFNHIGSVIAWDLLKEKGFKIEIVEFTNNPAAIQGVSVGEADIGWISVSGSLAAIEKGADLKALIENQGMIWRLYGKKELTDFKQLAGKPVADGVAGQITDFLLKLSIKKYSTDPQVIRFNNSSQRAQALLQGQVDAAMLAVDNIVDVEKSKPGQFRVILDYSKENPELGGSYLTANGKFLEQYPDAAQAMVEAMLITYRRAYDEPAWLLAEAKKKLPQVKDEVLKEQHQEFVLKARLWNPNGNADPKAFNALEQLYREGEVIKERIPLEKWAAPKFSEAALKKLGIYQFKN